MRYKFTILIIIFIGWISIFAQATPKYTDKKSAIFLARVLDKGVYKGKRILSTYVKNNTAQDYYISVILSDESIQEFNLNDIFGWTQNDQLILTKNRSLVFPDPENSSRFKVLDKNEFHKLALTAKTYIKIYGENDPLMGQKIHYRIKSFNLISRNEKGFGRNLLKAKYRYIIDLVNGQRELLTYADAYKVLQNNQLLIEDMENVPTLERSYRVTRVVRYPKSEIQDGISQFGLEVTFDKPIELMPSHYPVEVYEKRINFYKSGTSVLNFYFDLTLPNTTKQFEIPLIPNLEYLREIKIIPDYRFKNRMLLRAKFHSQFIDLPPVVSQTSPRSIYLTFFHLVDQTVYNRKVLLEEEKRKQKELESGMELEVSPKVNTNSQYGQLLLLAFDALNAANEETKPDQLIDALLVSIEKFDKAALFADRDQQLIDVLRQRNLVREKTMKKILIYVKRRIQGNSVPESDETLLKRLDAAESFTQKNLYLAQIEDLRRTLSKQ